MAKRGSQIGRPETPRDSLVKQLKSENTSFQQEIVRLREALADAERLNRARTIEAQELQASRAFAVSLSASGLVKKAQTMLRRARERAEHSFGRTAIPFALEPLAQVEKIASEGVCTRWESLGIDPSFVSPADVNLSVTGWVHLSAQANADGPFVWSPRVYVDSGGGFSEANVFSLAPPENGRLDAVFFIRATARRLRFDPGNQRGPFLLGPMTLTEISPTALLGVLIILALRRSGPRIRQLASLVSSSRRTGIAAALLHAFHPQQAELLYGKLWVDAYDTLSNAQRRAMRERAARFAYRPRISILIPTYNTVDRYLRKAVASVQAQLYDNWELCIADDASTAPHVRATLRELAAKDARIKLVLREKNGHISQATNSALGIATGEFISFFDHDDELSEHALFYVVDALNRHRELDLIYSDEDKIDNDGYRFEPSWKPDFAPHLIRATNFICHFTTVRKTVVDAIGGLRQGLEGSQDFDLTLRAVARTTPARIHHIPRVLYHWRAAEGSTALNPAQKSYSLEAGRRALADFLSADAPGAVVEGNPRAANTYRVRYPIPAPPPVVRVIILAGRDLSSLERCLASVRLHTRYGARTTIVAPSCDPSMDTYLGTLSPDVAVVRAQSTSASCALNLAAKSSASGVLVFLDSQIEVLADGWLEEMVSLAVQSSVGAVGVKSLTPDGRIAHAGIILNTNEVGAYWIRGRDGDSGGQLNRLALHGNFSAVSGACMAVRKSVFDEVGGFDEAYLPNRWADVDLCLRLQERGLFNVFTPYVSIVDHRTGTEAHDETADQHMRARWWKVLSKDPFYNPNLTPVGTEPWLAYAPRI